MLVPQCSTCTKQNEDCNIVDYVSYPYAEIEKLQNQVAVLHAKLAEAASTARIQDTVATGPSIDGSAPQDPQYSQNESAADDVLKEAEEVGILAVAGSNQQSQTTYGRVPLIPKIHILVIVCAYEIMLTLFS